MDALQPQDSVNSAVKTVNGEKRHVQTPEQIMQKSQKQPPCYVTSTDHDPAEYARVICVQEKPQEPVNEANHSEEACTQMINETTAGDNRRRARRLVGLNAIGTERKQGCRTNEATQEMGKRQSDSVVRMELSNQVTHVEKEQTISRIYKRKRKGLNAASNSGLQLRLSKRFAKDSPTATERQAASPNGHMPVAIADDEVTESEPDEQQPASPVQSSSDPPVRRSSSPWHEIPRTSSNGSQNLHSAKPPSCSNPDMSDPEHFARNCIPLEVIMPLAKIASKSPLRHMISQPGCVEECLDELMDSEGQELSPASQNSVY
ncbi:hypothetical protein ACP70R_010977 [Stipagrostis hirtigluma subsp. patula]